MSKVVDSSKVESFSSKCGNWTKKPSQNLLIRRHHPSQSTAGWPLCRSHPCCRDHVWKKLHLKLHKVTKNVSWILTLLHSLLYTSSVDIKTYSNLVINFVKRSNCDLLWSQGVKFVEKDQTRFGTSSPGNTQMLVNSTKIIRVTNTHHITILKLK